jgi:hypothetical protein
MMLIFYDITNSHINYDDIMKQSFSIFLVGDNFFNAGNGGSAKVFFHTSAVKQGCQRSYFQTKNTSLGKF